MLTRLRLGFSQLGEHKFRYGFKYALNPFFLQFKPNHPYELLIYGDNMFDDTKNKNEFSQIH